jgi:hypothetical protein
VLGGCPEYNPDLGLLFSPGLRGKAELGSTAPAWGSEGAKPPRLPGPTGPLFLFIATMSSNSNLTPDLPLGEVMTPACISVIP